MRRLLVLVGGDLGRSPRMLAHTLAAADEGVAVDLVGYAGMPLPSRITSHPRIAIHAVAAPGDRFVASLPDAMYAPVAGVRALTRAMRLIAAAKKLPRPDVVLVQTPPAVPGLLAARAIARAAGAALVVDWHSFSDAVLARRLGASHVAVSWLRREEMRLARTADAHLAVSRAIGDALRERPPAIDAVVVRDEPVERLTVPAESERATVLDRAVAAGALTVADAAAIRSRMAALLVAPTSWNGDDDFEALLAALGEYESRASAGEPPLVVLITGAGPLRAAFEAQRPTRRWQRVTIRCGWIPPDDYGTLLASADLGLCLHATAAGVDPPIKVADMRGASLPACVLGGGAWPAGDSGVIVFRGAPGLADALINLLRGFPAAPALARLRERLLSEPRPTWGARWGAAVRPILEDAHARHRESRS